VVALVVAGVVVLSLSVLTGLGALVVVGLHHAAPTGGGG
jgi:hypothetical protein